MKFPKLFLKKKKFNQFLLWSLKRLNISNVVTVERQEICEGKGNKHQTPRSLCRKVDVVSYKWDSLRLWTLTILMRSLYVVLREGEREK